MTVKSYGALTIFSIEILYMALGTQLVVLVNMLRNEIGDSTNSAQSVNYLPLLTNQLQRTQEFLYDDYNWPHLLVDVDTPLYAGQQYYTFDPKVNFNRIYGAYVYWSTSWNLLQYGINPLDYNYSNPATNQRSSASLKWNHYSTNQFEIWPIPDGTQNQTVRFRCTQTLPPLLADSDTAVIDDRLITLFAASEILARSKQADSAAKETLARQRYDRLKNNENKRTMGVMGGGVRRPYNHDWQLVIQGS